MYQPKPIDIENVQLPEAINALQEQLAENGHELWALNAIAQGRLDHPDLIPYSELSEDKKKYDRDTAMGALKAIYALGYEIVPKK